MNGWWDSLDRRAKAGLMTGVAVIAILTIASGWWLLRSQQAVLFADLKVEDAAVMAAELDKQKVAYTVADGGATLLVDASQVHATRMKLMGKDLPLRGAVGLELFNDTAFGMTEFAQKVNFQRALQGELTRTISSFAEVRDVRVHLALPEQTLFKQASARPKAAINLTMRAGATLRADQVSGIQRLVAAAVPGLSAQEVTVVDQQGVALSRAADGDGDVVAAGGRLDLKRETESDLSRKAGLVLDRAFGAGQSLASVDVTLNMDQVRTTTEDVLGAADARGGVPSGVIVRERESSSDNGAANPRGGEGQGARGSHMQREVDYQAGRRVEQVVSQPGAIRRLQVVAVVRQALNEHQLEQARAMVAAAVGAQPERGDTVMVQSIQPAAAMPAAPVPAVATQSAASAADAPHAWPSASAVSAADSARQGWLAAAILGAVLGIAALLALVFSLWTRRSAVRRDDAPAALTAEQRQLALRRVEAWLNEVEPTRSLGGPAVGASTEARG